MIRVGIGFDAHRFKDGDYVTLGGVKIPHTKAIDAHSDGDVAIHALVDAILGALGDGDIGQKFPNTDPRYKDCSSLFFLEQMKTILVQHKATINNADIMVISEAPKLRPHIDSMKQAMSKALGIEVNQIHVKAGTNEGLGFIGRQEGLGAMATVCLEIGS
jgi:2-C-methyl-D-erythritol 2,4-cyclodiphosphate synthase